ncbi:MAG TPA: S8 family serine peptidase [Candidatus Saccharimonadales bacterium]|nr:S8 family serine peptidase [Candidatus Saccharimonadales bacterium]
MKRLWLGMLVIACIGLGGGLAATRTAYAHSLWPWGRHVRTVPASVTIQPTINSAKDAIVVHMAYAGEQHVATYGGADHIRATKKITAAEVLINGTTRQVRQFKPSPRGNLDITIAISSLSSAERSQPLKIQAKIYTKYQSARHNTLAATSAVANFNLTNAISTVRWTPEALTQNSLNGTTAQATATFESKEKITDVSFTVSGDITDIVSPSATVSGTLDANTPYILPVTIHVPATKAAGSYKGVVTLLSGGKSVSVLPITVQVTAATASVIPQGIATPLREQIVPSGDSELLVVKDELVVGLNFTTSNPDQRIKDIALLTGGAIIGSIPETNTYQLRYTGITMDALKTKREQVAAQTDVAFAARNFAGAADTTPNDSEYPTGSWADTVHNRNNWGLKYIKAPQAWDITTGLPSTRIGIIDSSFAPDHEDLKNNVVTTSQLRPILLSDYALGDTPHGTHVAGIACASGNNGVGIAGMNWQCGLGLYDHGLNTLFDDPTFRPIFATNVLEQMKQAAKDNMRVVNMSFGWGGDSSQCGKPYDPTVAEQQANEVNAILQHGILWAEYNKKDVLWVFAAGNACRNITYVAPAGLAKNFPFNTIAVASIKETDAPVAELRTDSDTGANVSVAAPGDNIWSASLTVKPGSGVCIVSFGWACGSYYSSLSGTSQAAPFVSGLAGLVLSKHPDFTAEQVKKCIVDAANNHGYAVSGQSFKVINAPEAVKCETPLPATADCIFERGVRPDGCESANPTVQVDFSKTSSCAYIVRIKWDRDDPSTTQEFNVADLLPGGRRTLGTHTYSTPGDHWIEQDPIGSDGKSCVFVPLSYLFRITPPSTP